MPTLSWYGLTLESQFNGDPLDWTTATLKVAILDSGYTPNKDTDHYWSDISVNEAAANGDYVAGGVALASAAVSYDSTNDRVKLDAADLSLATATTGRYLVVYDDTGTDSTSRLLGYYDNGSDFGGGTSLDITWDATGVLRLNIL